MQQTPNDEETNYEDEYGPRCMISGGEVVELDTTQKYDTNTDNIPF